MQRRAFRLMVVALMVLLPAMAHTAPMPFNFPVGMPPIVDDSAAPRQCTMTYLVQDIASNDMYAARMQVLPKQDAEPVNGAMPCPTAAPGRMITQALEVCGVRAVDRKTCVFADMARDFQLEPEVRNTAENTSRCASDTSNTIGVACWKSGTLDVCSVACGQSAQEAVDLARLRCESKHQKTCDITGSLPVSLP